MTSAFDDDDLALSINPVHTRRGSARSPSEFPPQNDPMQQATSPVPQQGRSRPEGIKLPTQNQRLGQYTIIKTLGEGSFGKVKLAVHEGSKQKVALKIISRRKLMARDMAGRVEREIQYLQLLRHPHIIKLYTVITTEKEIIMVLEYAGSELFNYLVDNGKMAENKARQFFQQIVCAVEYCHRHKIVHRDLKPENLLLDENLHVKIADFGLSNIMTDGNFLKTSCGSPNYAAPEVISGKLYAGPEVDVWSCGVILYVLLVGRLPFDDEYIPALFKKIAQGNYHIPQYLSKGAASLIKKMLQVSPVQRITVQEIRQDPWFTKDLAEYLKPQVEEFLDTGVDPNKAIDPKSIAPTKPADVIEKLHNKVVGKLGKTMGYGREDVQQALSVDEPNAIKDAYLIVRENQLMRDTPSMARNPTLKPFLAQSPTGAQSPVAQLDEQLSSLSPSQRGDPSTHLDANRPSPNRLSSEAALFQSQAAATTIAVLPSSLTDFHKAYMSGHPRPQEQVESNEQKDASLAAEDTATRARRLNPHSRSQMNIDRINKPDPMTPLPHEKKKPKTTKWQFGIRSRNPPAEAMLAIYRALKAMGADWEVPRTRQPGEREEGSSPNRPDPDVGSISGSSADEGSDGSSEEGSPSSHRHSAFSRDSSNEFSGSNSSASFRDRGRKRRKRYGSWNDWGYRVPSDPWIINARFKKGGMGAPGVLQLSSASTSLIDVNDANGDPSSRRSSNVSGASETHNGDASRRGSANDPGVNPDNFSGPTANPVDSTDSAPKPRSSHSNSNSSINNPSLSGQHSGMLTLQSPESDDSAYVYLTIQLYALGNKDQEMYVVDFRCAGYERLVRRLVRVVGEESGVDSVADLNTQERAANSEQAIDEDPSAEPEIAHSPDQIPGTESPLADSEAERDAHDHSEFSSGRPHAGGNWDELKRRQSSKSKSRGASATGSNRGSGDHKDGATGKRSRSGTESRDFAPAAGTSITTNAAKVSRTASPEQIQARSTSTAPTSNPAARTTDSENGSMNEQDEGSNGYREEVMGDGRAVEEKDVSSPFPFLDVSSRLIIQLAEAS